MLSRAANEMSVGELRQLASCDALRFSERDYDRLIDSKTASLMSAACEIGAIAGTPAYREPLRAYGHALGMTGAWLIAPEWPPRQRPHNHPSDQQQ